MQRSAPVKEEKPIKKLTLNLPSDFHRRVKTYCSQNGVSMTDFVKAALSDAISPKRKATATKGLNT